jgi:hypothetical protein
MVKLNKEKEEIFKSIYFFLNNINELTTMTLINKLF